MKNISSVLTVSGNEGTCLPARGGSVHGDDGQIIELSTAGLAQI